jgi:regulator of protease activity HflC (stomatin/prohibitin superfamily)
MSNGAPGPQHGLTGDNVAASRADVSPQAKQNLKHKIRAKREREAAAQQAKKAKKK